jgi:hypothetical protein
MITDEMLEESSFYRMILEKGMEKGTVAEARNNLKLVLSPPRRRPGDRRRH